MPLLLVPICLVATVAAPPGGPVLETTVVFPVTPNNRPNYRIPAILHAPNGDVLVLAERRNDGPGDVGNHDIVLKRSRDKGRSWGAEQLVFDDGNDTCTDITVGCEAGKGRIWLFFLRDKKRFAYLASDDSGATWQGPMSIHRQVVRPEWDRLVGKAEGESAEAKGRAALWRRGWSQRYGVGPGNATIQLRAGPKAGRMIVPARHREDIGGGRLRSFSHVFFSDDQGASWRLGGTVGPNTSEGQLVELAGGTVMLVARNESAADAPRNLRHLVATSGDGGQTWGPIRRAEELITPRCHGAVERFTLPGPDQPSRLLFSHPAWPVREERHPYGRYNLSVRLSYDEGATWTAGKTIWPHPSSYSDIVVLDDLTVGLVYERGPQGSTHYWDEICFVRFNLAWLTDGKKGRVR